MQNLRGEMNMADSRPIKFRAWDKEDREMIYGIDECLMNWDNLKRRVDRFLNMPSHIPVMQYTGLRDKNGKEIYIGDILLLNNKNYDPTGDLYYEGRVIVRGTEDLGYTFEPVDPISEPFDSTSMWHVGEEDTTEIIGNTYENPSLLEEK